MRNEFARTGLFLGAAAVVVVAAAWVRPEAYESEIFSDQGEALFPRFTDGEAVKAIEVVDYDEASAAARPLKVEWKGARWVLSSHGDYPAEIGDRLSKTSGALLGLKRDAAVSDRVEDQATYGVIDPLDAKNASLAGRGKRVTLRDEGGLTLAEIVFGNAMEDKPDYRYARLPGQKRIYAVKTEADPSARFEDWVEADLLRLEERDITRLTLLSYSIDELTGQVVNPRRIVMQRDGEGWNAAARQAARTLAALRVAGARAKPKEMAEQLRTGRLQLSVDTMVSLQQRGFFLLPTTGQLLANEGELVVETQEGVIYQLRFGEIAPMGTEAEEALNRGENRYLLLTAATRDPALEAETNRANAKFADWYYIITGDDFEKLRPGAREN
jgi:hypothetical protein